MTRASSNEPASPKPERAPSRVRRYAIVLAAVCVAMIGRAIFEGRSAIQRSDKALAAGDVDMAIAEAMRATKWYVPLTTHPRKGYSRLRDIARSAEVRGDTDSALVAWQALRGGTRGTRSWWAPYAQYAFEADERIAHILASMSTAGIDRHKSIEQRVGEHRAFLREPQSASPTNSVALYTGLALWFWGVSIAMREVARSATAKPAGGITTRPQMRELLGGLVIAAIGAVAFGVAVVN